MALVICHKSTNRRETIREPGTYSVLSAGITQRSADDRGYDDFRPEFVGGKLS